MTTRNATIVPHGTPDYAELRALGLRLEEITLFSSNVNPYGPPPEVVDALHAALSTETVARYPDRLNLELGDLLSDYHALSAESFLVGNGSADIMWLIGLLHLQHARVAILNPTFGEYLNIARIMQAEVIDICHPGWVKTSEGYAPGQNDLHDVATALAGAKPDAIFVCNPNNPTGHALTPDELDQLYQAAPRALWIIDEAYAEFMQPPTTTAAWVERGNWLVLRSMTKDYALGGVRLGYMIGAPALIEPLKAAQSPWNVNTFAQIAGAVSLREGQTWRKETLTKVAAATQTLQASLRAVGYAPHPTTVNYFIVPVVSPSVLRRALLAEKLVVRDCTSFGLPHHIRIATQLPEANARLVQQLQSHTRHALPLTASPR